MRLILLIFAIFALFTAMPALAEDATPLTNFQKLLVINKLQSQKQELESQISQQTSEVYQDTGVIRVTAYVTEINLCQCRQDECGECIDSFTIAERNDGTAITPDKMIKVSAGDSFSDGEGGGEVRILDSSNDRLKIEISGVFDNGKERRKKAEIVKGEKYNFSLTFSDSAYYTLIDLEPVK